MTMSSSGGGGGLFRVGSEWFIDAAMLRGLARRSVVEPMLGGYQLLMSNSVVRFSPFTGAPLPGQAGLLFRAHHPDGSSPAANLRFAAGSPKGEWSDWPRLTATADCGCHHKTPAVASTTTPPCACKTKPAVAATMSAAGHLKIGTTFLALRQLTTNDGEPADWLDQDAAKQVHCTGCGTPVISTVAWSSDENRYRCEECEEQYPLADAVDPEHDDDATGELTSAKAGFIRRFKTLGDAIDAEDSILNRGVDPALFANFPQFAKDVFNRGNKAETAEYWRWLSTQWRDDADGGEQGRCEVCKTELQHMGASGVGCPRCADRELDELDKQAGDVERMCAKCGATMVDEGHGEDCPNGCLDDDRDELAIRQAQLDDTLDSIKKAFPEYGEPADSGQSWHYGTNGGPIFWYLFEPDDMPGAAVLLLSPPAEHIDEVGSGRRFVLSRETREFLASVLREAFPNDHLAFSAMPGKVDHYFVDFNKERVNAFLGRNGGAVVVAAHAFQPLAGMGGIVVYAVRGLGEREMTAHLAVRFMPDLEQSAVWSGLDFRAEERSSSTMSASYFADALAPKTRRGEPPSSGSDNRRRNAQPPAKREFSVPTLHEAGRFGSRGSRLNDQDLDLAELSEIEDRATEELTGTRQLSQRVQPPRFEGKSVGRINDRGWGSEVAADKMTARSRAVFNLEDARRKREREVPRPRDVTDALTFAAAYNILLEAVGENGSAVHPNDEHELSRQHVRALADREIQLQQSVLALLDVLMPGCQTQIYAVDELDHIEFMTNTLDDLTRRISQAGEDEESEDEDDAPKLLADLRAIVHNNVEEVEVEG